MENKNLESFGVENLSEKELLSTYGGKNAAYYIGYGYYIQLAVATGGITHIANVYYNHYFK